MAIKNIIAHGYGFSGDIEDVVLRGFDIYKPVYTDKYKKLIVRGYGFADDIGDIVLRGYRIGIAKGNVAIKIASSIRGISVTSDIQDSIQITSGIQDSLKIKSKIR